MQSRVLSSDVYLRRIMLRPIRVGNDSRHVLLIRRERRSKALRSKFKTRFPVTRKTRRRMGKAPSSSITSLNNNYHMTANASGFQNAEQDIDVRSGVPVEAKFSLKVGTSTESVTVVASGDLVENDPVTHTDVDRALFDKLPLESPSSSLSSLVTLASPGVSADSNGLFHGLGDHASNSFSVDGQPITDQQSKVFSNQIPLGCGAVHGSDRRRASGRVRRQNQLGDCSDDALRAWG